MILLVKNLLTVIATDFALQITVSIIDNAIRITFDIHAIIRVLSSIRIFSSAFYPPSAFSYPRFILHPHFLTRFLSSIRIFSSAFYPPSAFSHPYFLIRHPYPPSASVSAFYPYLAQLWGKGRILHVSYLLNEFGDPNFFFFFYYVLIIKFTPGKFQQIFISRTITDELPSSPRTNN